MAAAAAPRFAPEDPTLPKPWRGLVDGKTGYLYFWNPETNITQYERPTAPSLSSKPSPMPINSSAQVEQPSRHANSPVKEDDRYGRSSNGGSTNTNTQTRNGQNERSVVAQSVSNGTIDEAGRVAATGLASSAGVSVLSAEAYRRRHEITVTNKLGPGVSIGDDIACLSVHTEEDATSCKSLRLASVDDCMWRMVYSAGFTAPTPIQAQSWAVVLQSRDIVAIAKTGSGKTLGYLIPAFLHLKRLRNDTRMGPTVLVLSPTRELATQIQDEAVKFGKSSRISCTCLYGGAPKGPQLGQLDRGTDIVVATPGRLNDILEMRRVNLGQISYLVLDEADRMLDMGFEPQIRKIVKEVPTRRQTLMYTATWPKEVRKIAADLLVNPVQVNIGNVDELVANKSITQYVEVVPPMEKHKRLEQILRSQEPGSKVIIFCSTKKMCDILARNLTRQFGAAAIHGDKSQGERDQVLSQFRSGRSPLLVATDVAARGLDVKDIRAVINYDFPTGVEDYVHRIGRTGRAGATGVAYTFFGEQDAKHATDLVKLLEGANQKVPPEIRDMASRGGGMGRSRRWGNGDGGGRGGYGSTGGSYGSSGGGGFGSSGGGRGSSWSGGRGYGQDNNDRYGGGGGGDKAGSSWNDRFKSGERERSRSPGPVRDRSPPRSFHQAMMDRR
ncbi:DEAD-box ATP-dependent RNA helicase 46 [Linum perenne]